MHDENFVLNCVSNILNTGVCEAVTNECQINCAMNTVLICPVYDGVVVCLTFMAPSVSVYTQNC